MMVYICIFVCVYTHTHSCVFVINQVRNVCEINTFEILCCMEETLHIKGKGNE